MEFFLGAFERDWEHRRATLLHELQMGEHEGIDWDRPRRGGVAHLPEEGAGRQQRGGRRPGSGSGPAFRGGTARPMPVRFAALARGSQPAVVKLASYGGGVRAAAMMSYASRRGELPVENERGEHITGKAALASQRGDWEHLFDNRATSRDVGMFEVTIADTLVGRGRQELVREILSAGFGDRRFVYAVEERNAGEIEVRGVVVLRDRNGERLTADAKAADIAQERFENSEVGCEAEARFRFRGHGNGVEFATARVRELVERVQGDVKDETGRVIQTFDQSGDLVQKEWRRELHSRKGRDVMHLIVSARAGTNATAFHGAVRDFLGEQFGGHRYIFALHDPADDPKETRQGGRRPHIHAHAIVTMRSETGERIQTSPQVFRQWRALMAEKAREHGIDMELTDRRDLASPPAYGRNQARPVSYVGRTEHEGTSRAAQARYDAKRANRHSAARWERSVGYAVEAAQAWGEVVRSDSDKAVSEFAAEQIGRLQAALRESQIDIEKFENSLSPTNLNANMIEPDKLIGAGETPMRAMTRPEFEAYGKRVEAVLAAVEASIEPAERKEFDEVAATAREVVNIRREYLELSERQGGIEPVEADRDDNGKQTSTRDEQHLQEVGGFQPTERDDGERRIEGRPSTDRDQQHNDGQASTSRDSPFDDAVARHGESAVREGDEILAEYDAAFHSLDRATDRYSTEYFRADISDDERAAVRADYFAESNRYDTLLQRYAREALDGNTYLYERSKGEESLLQALNDEAQVRASRRAIDMYDPTRNLPARQNDAQAVRAGDALFAQIDAAKRDVHRYYEPEARDIRSTGRSGRVEGEAEGVARIARLSEAEIRHADLLREAARAALDGNGYIRDMATIRHDLNNEIQLEIRRRAEAERGRHENVREAARPSESGDRTARVTQDHRADPPQQQVPRLRELEREVEERHHRTLEDRER
ncbi:hypothetical protein FJW08_23370 [Mesorhizobium sp. B3-2-1]|uniref:relaxase/mobilization nuclease domain-containing protein n=1 Tax=Mesorhizobium sp. B3-2-1 TaxID=2589891 RepID=UPI00112DE8EA|nr:hypothetical protein [Mesorhizobium sp. B3-2-1]TPI27648.1 hypothetical protein FJW08_23370 [Mesorhizobium sp. B3-2-1]